MASIFEKRDRWGNRKSLWILVLMVVVMPLAWQASQHIHLENDVENWLPSDDPQAQVLRWYRDNFPIEDRFLLSWSGSSLDDPRVQRLAEALEGTIDADGVRRDGVAFVAHVITPQDVLQEMTEHEVPRPEAIRRLQGVLVGPGYLKVRLTDAGRAERERVIEQLTALAQQELGIALLIEDPTRAADDGGRDEEALDEDASEDTAEAEIAADATPADGTASEFDFQVHWPTMHVERDRIGPMTALATGLRLPRASRGADNTAMIEACFLEPGLPVALSVELSEAGSSDRSAAFLAIRETAERVGIPQDDLHLGGRPVAGHALNQAVKRSAWNRDPSLTPTQFYRKSVILTSVAVGIILAYLMLQSFRLATLVIVSAIYTMFVAVSLVPVTGGSMNMVLVVMPTLLMVLTMSAGIHVANYWRHAAFENPDTSISHAFRMAKTPCLLAAVTTSIGLISLATSPLVPVREFGLYSAVGCLLSLLVILFGLPAMLQLWPGQQPTKHQVHRRGWKALGRFIARQHLMITVTCVVGCVACSVGLTRFRTETKVIRYFADDSRVVQDYHFLENNLAGIIPVNAVVRFDADSQDELNFLQRMEIVRRVQQRMSEHPDVSGTMSLADFQPERKPPDLTSLTTIGRLREVRRYNLRARKTEDAVHASTDRVRSFVTVAQEARSLDGPGNKWLNQAGDEMWNVTAQVAIMSDLDYGQLTTDLDQLIQSELKLIPGANHRVTGMIPLFLRTQQAVLDSLLLSFGLAFGVIAVVMMILLKNPLSGLITMVPNLLPVCVVFGLISWNRMAVDMGTMITASVALGIAVDGTLHLLTWFRAGIRAGKSRDEAIADALGHCGPAMWQTSFAIGLGLLVLYPAELLLISRFGWLMAALIGTALIADIILLPALLAGPLGSLIERAMMRADRAPGVPRAQPVQQPHLQQASSESQRIMRFD